MITAFLEHMNIFFLLRIFAAIFALSVLGMASLIIIRRVKPEVREDGALMKKWKRAFSVFVALGVISVFMVWRSIYRYNEQTLVLESSELFNFMFYYGNGRLCVDSYFLMRIFMVMIPLGTLGMISLLIIRKVKPEIREDGALMKKWKRAFSVFAALAVIPVLVIASGS